MRHGVKKAKLGRTAEHRRSMLCNLAASVIVRGAAEDMADRQVKTTVQKAKAVRPLVERLITYGKKGDLSARRQAARFLRNNKDIDASTKAVSVLFDVVAPRYSERKGGYCRILKLSTHRVGDAAEMAIISLVEEELPVREKSSKKVESAEKAKTEEVVVEEASDESEASEDKAEA